MVVTLTLGAWWWTSSAPAGTDIPVDPEPTFVAAEASPEAILMVHVAGEVRRPGVVRLAAGSRVVDAIEAAGGATPSAVLAGVNLASPVVDGSQIVVPSSAAGGLAAPAVDDGVVVVNRATATELESLPGVGPVLAERILLHRAEHGPFETVEDLLDVSGIGEAILARLRPLVRIP